MRKETNHESSLAQCYGATDKNPPSPMATAWQANKHEISQVLKQAVAPKAFGAVLSGSPDTGYPKCAEDSALYSSINDNPAAVSWHS